MSYSVTILFCTGLGIAIGAALMSLAKLDQSVVIYRLIEAYKRGEIHYTWELQKLQKWVAKRAA